MRLPRPKTSTVTIAISVLALAAVTCAQYRLLPGRTETVVRTITDGMGLFATPILIVLAYRAWANSARSQLPAWRNCLGSGSMAIVFLVWIFHSVTGTLLLGPIWRGPTRFFGLEWTAFLLYSNLVAILLAVALRGVSRTQAIAAALFVWAYLESGIYF